MVEDIKPETGPPLLSSVAEDEGQLTLACHLIHRHLDHPVHHHCKALAIFLFSTQRGGGGQRGLIAVV